MEEARRYRMVNTKKKEMEKMNENYDRLKSVFEKLKKK